MATIHSATGFNGDFSMDFASLIPGCNPIHGGVNYLNTNCFTPPTAPASLRWRRRRIRTAARRFRSRHYQGTAPAGQQFCSNVLGNTRRNQFYGPGLTTVDFSIFKNTPVPKISETFNVQFRAEFFNILNHTNFIGPNFLNGSQNNSIFDFNGSRAADRAESNVHFFTADSTRIETHLVVGGLA